MNESNGVPRDFTRYRPQIALFGEKPPHRELRLVFIVGSTDISGGTYVILQHVLEAEDRGDNVTIVPLFEPTPESTRWHPAFDRLRLATFDEISGEEFDIAVATWWRTVYYLDLVRARHYVYFVQSIESRFYDESEDQVRRAADATYDLDLHIITETPWIQWYLALQHRRPSVVVPNGIEKTLYTPHGPVIEPRIDDSPRMLVEGPVGVPMKNVEQTLELIKTAGPFESWLLTSSEITEDLPVDRVFSRIPVTATPAVYRSCDVLVKLSLVEGMFGPPLEMFHCGGTTICWDVTGHEDYVRNGDNGIIVKSGDTERTIEAIRHLGEQLFERRRLQRGALETASQWPSWRESSTAFRDALEVLARQPERPHGQLFRAVNQGRMLIA